MAFGSPIRAALWSTRTVSRPASPGVTSFGPPLKPAKKCGSTNPVVIRRSASTQRRLIQTGTPSPCSPRKTSESLSRASWLTTRTRSTISSPSIARISSSVLPRWVPVATRITTSSSGTPSSSSTAGIILSRGCARVPSHIEIATFTGLRASSLNGGPATGARRASRSTAASSAAPSW